MPIAAASDVAANGLGRDDYIKLLATGTGLPSQQVDATNTAWEGLEMTAPVFVMPGESGDRNFRRSITTEVSRDGERSASQECEAIARFLRNRRHPNRRARVHLPAVFCGI